MPKLYIFGTFIGNDENMTAPKITYSASEAGLDKALKLAVPVSVLLWIALLMMIL